MEREFRRHEARETSPLLAHPLYANILGINGALKWCVFCYPSNLIKDNSCNTLISNNSLH